MCAEEVLRRLNLLNSSASESDDADDLSEDEGNISTENNVTPDGDDESTYLHQEEELYNEASDEEFYENNSDVSDDSEHVDSVEENFTSPSGVDWSSVNPPVRPLERNIIRFREGTTVNPTNESQAFLLFINDTILFFLGMYETRVVDVSPWKANVDDKTRFPTLDVTAGGKKRLFCLTVPMKVRFLERRA